MELAKSQIKSFQELYENKYKKEISEDEAQEMGNKLISVFLPILLPHNKTTGES